MTASEVPEKSDASNIEQMMDVKGLMLLRIIQELSRELTEDVLIPFDSQSPLQLSL